MFSVCGSCLQLVFALLQQTDYKNKLLNWAAWLTFAGIVLFRNSLYLNNKILGVITPIGDMGCW